MYRPGGGNEPAAVTHKDRIRVDDRMPLLVHEQATRRFRLSGDCN
ncbi:hypothetical protein [Telmatospirillum siberiense]|nr:hypothetical protein [Telmatospirillum siberiense]